MASMHPRSTRAVARRRRLVYVCLWAAAGCNWIQNNEQVEPAKDSSVATADASDDAGAPPRPPAEADSGDVESPGSGDGGNSSMGTDSGSKSRGTPMDSDELDAAPEAGPPSDGGAQPPDAEPTSPVTAPVADASYCASVADATSLPMEIEYEDAALELLNLLRSRPQKCGDGTELAPAPPLHMNPALRCAARLDARDRTARGVGEQKAEAIEVKRRTQSAGWLGGTPSEVPFTYVYLPDGVQMRMQGEQCPLLMDSTLDQIGIAYDFEAGPSDVHNWTLTFGAARGFVRSDVGATPECAVFGVVPESWKAEEDALFELIAQRRAEGVTCRDGRFYPPVSALQRGPKLHCYARMRAREVEMGPELVDEQHIPTPEVSTERAREIGWAGGAIHENLADLASGAADLMAKMVDSIEHCSNMMLADSAYVGIGYNVITPDDVESWSVAFSRDAE